MAGLVTPYGYGLDEHFVITDDGYILRLFRLKPKSLSWDATDPSLGSNDVDNDGDGGDDSPATNPNTSENMDSTACADGRTGSSNCGQDAPRPVVFMQHPLMGSSVDYVVMGPGRSLGFMLVDAGYDVWLTNVRGNRFSRNHTRLDPDSLSDRSAFWAFSWDEHAALDLPAAMEFVAAATGQQQMLFVGYSQGTTIGLAALSSQPAVARRVAGAVLLAPVAFVSHMTSPLFRMMAEWRVEQIFNRVGLHEYAAHSPVFSELAASFCGRYPWPCERYLYLLCGANPHGNLAPGLLPEIMRFLPSGTSVQNMAHWGQLVRAENRTRLSYFDYGTNCSAAAAPEADGGPSTSTATATGTPTGGYFPCNQAAYAGASSPPAYPLHAITTPLALFTGGHDSLADPLDAVLLLQALGGDGTALSTPSGGGQGASGSGDADEDRVSVEGLGGGPVGGALDSSGVGGVGGAAGSGPVKLHHHEPDYGHLDFGVGQDAADRIYPLALDFLRTYTPAVTLRG